MDTTKRFKLIGMLALCLFIVPIIGWLTGQYSESRFDDQFKDVVVNQWKSMSAEEFSARKLGYVDFCAQLMASGNSDAGSEKFCSSADEVQYVKTAALATGGAGVLLFCLILGGKALAGTNRKRMTLVFGPLIRIVMLLLAISVVAQGALFVYSVYTLEVTAIQRVHGVLLLFIGLGALAACWALIKAAVGFMKGEPMVIRGIALKKSNQPDLFGLIAEVAAKLKSHLPDHVVVGLEPNFFVTAADVKLVPSGEVLKGKTLFVSLGLLRTLTKAELTAVIGHEFGHFRGDDVAYSLKFAPTYTRLGQAITKLGDTAGNASDIGKLPALVALSICLSEFASAERSVGRERELLADKAGAQAADATSLATALVKVSLYAGQWGTVTNALTDEIVKGNTFTNLAQVYANLCQNTVTQIDWPAARDILGQNVQSHPVDTHPSLLARLQGLSTSLFDITPEALFLPEAPASNLIHEAEQMETALSDFEARWLVAIGAVIPPTRTSE